MTDSSTAMDVEEATAATPATAVVADDSNATTAIVTDASTSENTNTATTADADVSQQHAIDSNELDSTMNENEEEKAMTTEEQPNININLEHLYAQSSLTSQTSAASGASSMSFEGPNPVILAQAAMDDFLTEMTKADLTANELFKRHKSQQQALLQEFAANSLRLMHQFNKDLQPTHAILKNLKAPLEDVLLSRFIAIPCTILDKFAKKQKKTFKARTWGVTQRIHQYNKKNHLNENAAFQFMDLGPELRSLRTMHSSTANTNTTTTDTSTAAAIAAVAAAMTMTTATTTAGSTDTTATVTADTQMPDNNSNAHNHDNDGDAAYNRSVENFLNGSYNITASQIDSVLRYISSSRAIKRRVDIVSDEKAKQKRQRKFFKQQREEQRRAGAQTLLSVIPYLTVEQCMTIMEMKNDNLQRATEYGLAADSMELFFEINEWQKKHPAPAKTQTTPALDGDGDSDGDDDDDAGDGFVEVGVDGMHSDNENIMKKIKKLNTRSQLNKGVLNRSARTGAEKSVIFRCTNISADGEITLVGVLDRNYIPLDPTDAKMLHLTIKEFMSMDDCTIMDAASVVRNINTRVLHIVFQITDPHKQEKQAQAQAQRQPLPQMEDITLDSETINNLLQTVQIPDHLIQSGNLELMQRYAKQFVLEQHQQERQAAAQMQPTFNVERDMLDGSGYGRHHRAMMRLRKEFTPISYAPSIRDWEYDLDFDNSMFDSAASLRSVRHRTDGQVLFTATLDTGENVLIGAAMNSKQAIEIYSEVVDDITHNIICILLDNHLPTDFVIDTQNLSLTNISLADAIADSQQAFDKVDLSGKKLSYKIIVNNGQIVAFLTKIGNEIKNMPFVEHFVPTVGSLVRIPQRTMVGLIQCIPTGLIITNDPNTNVTLKSISYQKNVHSNIQRKHWASDNCQGYIDIDVLREGEHGWRALDSPLRQAFAVVDIQPASDTDIAMFIAFKEANQSRVSTDIERCILGIEADFALLQSRKNQKTAATANEEDGNEKNDHGNANGTATDNDHEEAKSSDASDNRRPQEILNTCTSNIKKLQELISSMKSKVTSVEDEQLLESSGEKMNQFNRQVRGWRFEVRMM